MSRNDIKCIYIFIFHHRCSPRKYIPFYGINLLTPVSFFRNIFCVLMLFTLDMIFWNESGTMHHQQSGYCWSDSFWMTIFSAPGSSLRILDWTCYQRTPLMSNLYSHPDYFSGVLSTSPTDCTSGIWCRGLTGYVLYINTLVLEI